jgi:hypothetical protein
VRCLEGLGGVALAGEAGYCELNQPSVATLV